MRCPFVMRGQGQSQAVCSSSPLLPTPWGVPHASAPKAGLVRVTDRARLLSELMTPHRQLALPLPMSLSEVAADKYARGVRHADMVLTDVEHMHSPAQPRGARAPCAGHSTRPHCQASTPAVTRLPVPILV